MLLMFVEPSILASEPVLGLAGTWRHKAVGENSNYKGDYTLNQKSKLLASISNTRRHVPLTDIAILTNHADHASAKCQQPTEIRRYCMC